MSVQVPTNIDAGLGGGAATTAVGAGAAQGAGVPSLLVWILVGFMVLFLGLLVWRLGARGARKAPTTLAVILLLSLGAGIVAFGASDSGPAVAKKSAPASNGLVALSFDDGPSPEVTPEILEILEKADVRATFFLQGNQARKYPELVKDIQEAGHVIGNHSYGHPDFTDLTYDQAYESIEWTNNILEDITGIRPVLFRYPYGNSSSITDQAVRDTGMYDVLWHWSQPGQGDFDCPGAKAVEQYAQNQLAPGAIILLHDGGETVQCGLKQVKYLPKLIKETRKRGFDFGVVDIADGPSAINQYSWVKVTP